MALTACKECGKEISTEAEACPHCGAKPKRKNKLTGIIVAVILGLWITHLYVPQLFNSADNITTVAAPEKRCAVDAIQIKSMKARFIDGCSRSTCYSMKGVAVLNNGCAEPVGVQVKITAPDASGAPVAARDLWPASVSNIPPGDYTFSLDHYLEYDSRIKSFTVQPITVRQWRER